ncbi:hypothetical protein [Nonomuraea longicatena]|uniref:Uncharacterized protein n=1 Tax=Nonomuraea longicatena TaxID=83682 RepID=A0ABP4BB92_9ACTN
MNGPRNRTRGVALAALTAGLGILATGVGLLALPAVAGNPSAVLDDVPGFGRSPEAALRDNTIAYWEAYQREQVVTACMSRSGFTYWQDVAFPEAEVVKISEELKAPQPRTVTKEQQTPAAQRNGDYETRLAAQDRERYSRALSGESAAEMSEFRRTGTYPKGRGPDFGVGGCLGEATTEVPSIWDTKRRLEDQRQLMRDEIAASPQLNAIKSEYAACAERTGGIDAQSPADVDAHAVKGPAQQKAAALALESCNEIWAKGYRAAEDVAAQRFAERNATVLAGARQRYKDTVTRIGQDQGFLRHLGERAAVIRTLGLDRQ